MAPFASLTLDNPLPPQDLHRLRLALRKKVPSAGQGAHLHRRMGQSQSFRAYRDYHMGEDIRAVDWAASARKGGKWDLIAKSFEAEEQRDLMILLDCRPAMRLPRALPKLCVAIWIAQCLTAAALAEKDRVIVAPVFAGDPAPAPLRIDGLADMARLRTYAATQLAGTDWQAVRSAGLGPVRPMLRPAAAVVLITDALFDDPAGQMAGFARAAQQSYRTFHLVEIDSWPHERALLTEKPFRLQALAGRVFGDRPGQATAPYLQEAADNLAARRKALRDRFGGPGLVWPGAALRYPAGAGLSAAQAQDWFRRALPKAAFLDSLLSRVG